MIIHLELVRVMIKVVWVLGSPTLPTKKSIVAFMVVILCHLRVYIIHPGFICTKTGPITHHILVGTIIMLLLVMLEVVLIIGPPTYPSIKFRHI